MKVFSAIVLCLAIAAAQAGDYDNLIELRSERDFYGPSNRIVGGVEASPHSLPHQVGLYISREPPPHDNGDFFCGGSLLSMEWVLTSAHCADLGNYFEAVLGAHNIRNENETSQERLVATEKIVHPAWNATQQINDVALLHIPEALHLSDIVEPIRLPSRGQAGNNFNGTKALASGWGWQDNDVPETAVYLQEMSTRVLDYTTCRGYYAGHVVQAAHVCTSGTSGQGTCVADFGGPLIIQEQDGKTTQIGVASVGFATRCGNGLPSVYARLTTYIDFIANTTGLEIRP